MAKRARELPEGFETYRTDGKRRCWARSKKRDNAQCGSVALAGQNVCRYHGGATPQALAAAGRRLAAVEWSRSFGTQAESGDPAETVLDEIRWASGHVAWLRDRVQETEPEALTWGVESEVNKGSGEFPGIDITTSAKSSTWVRLYGEERDRLIRMCKIAHDMGIAERHVELAERVGGLMADLLGGVLGELNLTGEQQELASAAVPRHLQLAARELAG